MEKKNLIGCKFGRLLVLKEAKKESKRTFWECQCECGQKKTIQSYCLISGQSKSCGCWSRELTSKRFFKDLTGQTINEISILEPRGKDKNGHIKWLCKCKCGKKFTTLGTNLIDGKSKSCGCNFSKLRKNKEGSLIQLYNKFSKTAKKRQLDNDISYEVFIDIIHKNCYYCGSVPSNMFSSYFNKKGELKSYAKKQGIDEQYANSIKVWYNGIDRVDNNLGYHIDNIKPCCAICNRAKYRMSAEEYITWLKRIKCDL